MYGVWCCTLRLEICWDCSTYKGKIERMGCRNYKVISLSSMVGKIYAGILVDKVRKVIKGLIDDEQGGLRAGRGFID